MLQCRLGLVDVLCISSGSGFQPSTVSWLRTPCSVPPFMLVPNCDMLDLHGTGNIAHNLDLQPSARSRTQWIAFARPWKKHDAEQLADEPTSGRGTGIWPRICSRGVELFFLVVGSITGPMFYQKIIICTTCEVCFYCFLSEIFLLHHLDQTNSSSLNIVPIRNQHASSSW